MKRVREEEVREFKTSSISKVDSPGLEMREGPPAGGSRQAGRQGLAGCEGWACGPLSRSGLRV